MLKPNAMNTQFRVSAVCSLAMFLVASYSDNAVSETVAIDGAQLKWVDNISVSCRDAGVVESIAVAPNDGVKRDAVLVQLEKERHLMEVDGAEKSLAIAMEQSRNDVNLRFAKKSAEVARKELQRTRAAVAQYSRAVSQSQLEQTELELEQAMLSGDQALHELTVAKLTTDLRSSELNLAKLNADRRTISSPIDGSVAEVLVQEGEWVDAGRPVARVVNLAKLRIVALVAERYLFQVSKGQSAKWQLRLGEQSIAAEGEISFVSPEVNPVNREFLIWVDIDNQQGKLRPGLVGTLTLELATQKLELAAKDEN